MASDKCFRILVGGEGEGWGIAEIARNRWNRGLGGSIIRFIPELETTAARANDGCIRDTA